MLYASIRRRTGGRKSNVKAWMHGKKFHFLALLIKELHRIQFENASIRPGVGIYVILDFFVFAQICTELSRKCLIRASGNLPGIYLNRKFQFWFWFSTNCTMYTVYLLTCSSYSKQLLQNLRKNALSSGPINVFQILIQHFIHRLKSRTILYHIINSTTGKYCSVVFIWLVTL